MELHDGNIILFKDNINILDLPLRIEYYLNFTSGGLNYNFFFNTSQANGYVLYFGRTGQSGSAVYDQNNGWFSESYKTIIVTGDQTITDNTFINWLYENTVSGLPPRVMENMYAVVGDQVQYSFSNIGDVVGSIVNNGVLTIFTLGIFIVSLAVGLLRRITRRKNFKK